MKCRGDGCDGVSLAPVCIALHCFMFQISLRLGTLRPVARVAELLASQAFRGLAFHPSHRLAEAQLHRESYKVVTRPKAAVKTFFQEKFFVPKRHFYRVLPL